MATAALVPTGDDLDLHRTERTAPRPRERAGWRAGRPLEDPQKMKRWGYVSAKPSEYLVHVRRGQMTARSGQGATCFKWPWDSVAVIPTSLQRLSFCADQVTAEKVGVEVMGFAVYRIADPRQAYRVLNFSFPERAQEKLEQTLTAMFVGATRRLVANLTVEQCLQKRKSALAQELLREIAPVVGGLGRADDATDRGWGVVLDTIEIQEVRVLSEAVFAAMQAPFRATLDREAREAQALAEQAIAAKQATCQREIEQARIDASQAIEKAKLEADAELRRRRAEMEREQEEGKTRLEVRRRELEAEAARAALAAHEVRAAQQTRQLELQQVLGAMDLELRKLQAEAVLSEGRAQAEVQLRQAEAARQHADADAKRLVAEKLPQLAAAMGQRISEVKVAQYGSGEHPLAHFATALGAFLDLVEQR